MENNKTATDTVIALSKMNITGNVIPLQWLKNITNGSGKSDLTAIMILSDIVYWYRPKVIRDEFTGNVIRYEKRFAADLLQRSYKALGDLFGITKRQARDACHRLQDKGLITLHFRTVEFGIGNLANNVLFIELHADALEKVTYEFIPVTEKEDPLLRKNVIAHTQKGNTNTETTTETTTNTKTNTRTHPKTEEIPQEKNSEPFTEADFKTPEPTPHRTAEDVRRGVEKATVKFFENAGKAPWLQWYSGKIYSRGEIKKENLQHVGWLYEQITGTVPNSPEEWSRWRKIHEIWYRESQFDFELLEDVLNEKCSGKYKTYNPTKITEAITAAVGENRKHEQEGGMRVVIPGQSSPGLKWQ